VLQVPLLLLKSLLLKVPTVVLVYWLLLVSLLLMRSMLLKVPAVVMTSVPDEDSESNLSRRMLNAHFFLFFAGCLYCLLYLHTYTDSTTPLPKTHRSTNSPSYRICKSIKID
jgi:hypothetical protein